MNRIEIGDCRDTMRRWAGEGVKAQMCVTSPPYFGLRDYGVDGQIGLESSPDEYVAALVEVFRCVRDVLADDGTLWLNIGDSYNSLGGIHAGRDDNQVGVGAGNRQWREGSARADGEVRSDGMLRRNRNGTHAPGMKPKDLIGIPWMLAFALRADGWYLRQDIIWHKPNPMPESVRDRCTKAHEYIFLLSKSDRYYFDSEAMKEPAVCKTWPNVGRGQDAARAVIGGGPNMGARENAENRNRRSVWTVATQPYSGAHFATFPPALIEPCILAGSRSADIVLDPFMGSGTTAQVAQQLGRQYIGCELNPQYLSLQSERTAQQALLLA
jgi:DNA modification methylase